MKLENNFLHNPDVRAFQIDLDGIKTPPPRDKGTGSGEDGPDGGKGQHGVPRPLKNGGVAMQINLADVIRSFLIKKVDAINAAQSEEEQFTLINAFPEAFRHLLIASEPDPEN